jgi:hypothetical protein
MVVVQMTTVHISFLELNRDHALLPLPFDYYGWKLTSNRNPSIPLARRHCVAVVVVGVEAHSLNTSIHTWIDKVPMTLHRQKGAVRVFPATIKDNVVFPSISIHPARACCVLHRLCGRQSGQLVDDDDNDDPE